MSKASVGVAIIARNASNTIGACLDSIVPYAAQTVVCVDEATTDDTAEVARAHGAEVYPVTVSEPHECEGHGKVMAQDFAKARNASFAHLRRDVDWWCWIDSDDIVIGGEKLAPYLAKLPPTVEGVWLPYAYAAVGAQCSTLFDRERLLRVSVGWEWRFRVHEIAVPKDRPSEAINWARTDIIRVQHQDRQHDTAGSARRNILLLEIDLEADPNDQRALFYLGNQYFALGEWEAAAQAYEAATHNDNTYQLWQTLVYLSMAYEKLGNLDEAMGAAFRALDVAPFHPEPYWRLAALYMLQGDVVKCEFWTRLAEARVNPPGFVFQNPLDRTFNSRVTLAQAYGNAGRVSQARRLLEQAYRVVPNEEVARGIAGYGQIETNEATANAVVRVLNGRKDDERILLYAALNLPTDVKRFGRVRDAMMPALLRRRPNTQPRLVVWCGRSAEPWAPPSLDTTGIGGSETAVIQIAKRFATDGWRVDVYNDCDHYEGVYEDVGYWDCRRLASDEAAEVLVSWRQPDAHGLPVSRRVSLLWCHDLNSGPGRGDALGRWDRTLGVSRWHADYLSRVYGLSNVDHVPNGIELSRFASDVRKVPFRCVYASAPDRGLIDLLHCWPAILASEPTVELHIGYGWQTFDRYIAAGHTQLVPIKQQVLDLLARTPRVVWRDRLPQNELAQLYGESYCWLYPTRFLEVSAISAMEAMAGGCVPVTSAAGALPETIGDGGLVVTGNPYTKAWREFWLLCVRAALTSPEIRLTKAHAGRERAAQLTWEHAFTRWRDIVTGLLEGKKEMVARENVRQEVLV